jgi:DNA ligase-1
MKSFGLLCLALENSADPERKKELFRDYACKAGPTDRMWAISLLMGRVPRRVTTVGTLKNWALQAGDVSAWLFEESVEAVGELAETISLILPPARFPSRKSLTQWMTFLHSLDELNEFQRHENLLAAWDQQEPEERLLIIKLLAGSFRSPMPGKLVTEAVAELAGARKSVVAHRLAGNWHPDQHSLEDLLAETGCARDVSQPYLFSLAHALEDGLPQLGEPSEWQAEWKWDGIRAQLVKREGELFIWSRGEELVTAKFPELALLHSILPEGTVIDGEIIGFCEGCPLPPGALQSRFSRKNVSAKSLRDCPAILVAFDLLEINGDDIRPYPLQERREKLETLLDDLRQESILLSDSLEFATWHELQVLHGQARENCAEGIMLKRKNSPYLTGRRRGDWWKWKSDPHTLDGVLMYAQQTQSGSRFAYTDLTFGLWDGDGLVPFARLQAGLDEEQTMELEKFIRENTLEKFGPVRTVKPQLVFEIAFAGVELSARHKSGLSVRSPRLLRWRNDKPADEANSLSDLRTFFKPDQTNLRLKKSPAPPDSGT